MHKTIRWKLFGALLLIGVALASGPATGHEYCCSCDYSYSYYLCYSGCPSGDQACQTDCWNAWNAAEAECIQSCPWPVC